MRNIDKYRGVFPALYACYDATGAVSQAATFAYASWLADKGVDGLYVCGSSGECVYQSVSERMATLESVMAAVGGRLTVIAHVAAATTDESVALARHAREVGANAIAAIPPIYYQLSERAIEEYWLKIAEAGKIDFFIYNIPQLSGYALSPELLKRMLDHRYIAGVKNTSLSAQDIARYKRIGGDDFAVFNGPDEQYLAGRVMGASGGIGATYGIMPELYLALEALIRERDLEAAGRLQFEICGIIDELFALRGHLYAACKEVMRARGLDLGGVRPPLPGLGEGDAAKCALCAERIERARASFA